MTLIASVEGREESRDGVLESEEISSREGLSLAVARSG